METERPTCPGPHRPTWRPAVWGALAGLVLGGLGIVRLYTGNFRLGAVPETISAVMAAHSLVHDGDFDIAEHYPRAKPGQVLSYAVRWRGGRLYSIEPPASLLTFALFLLPYRNVPPLALPLGRINNVVAARVTSLTLVLLGGWLLTLASPLRALLAVGTIALATSYRTIAGAGLWQHTSGGLWLAAGLLVWSCARYRASLYPLSGVLLGLATACRPILVPAPLLVAVDASRRRGGTAAALATLAAVVAVGALALGANLYLHGSLLGGRAEIVSEVSKRAAVPAYFSFSPMHLLGLLVAPSRGLFIYSPVLIFALPGLVRSLRSSTAPSVRLMSVAGLLTFVLYGFIATWWAGWVFGPRYMVDVLPFFALWLALTPLPGRRRTLWGAALVAAGGWSLWVQALGASAYPCGWNSTPISVDKAPERLWDWSDTQIARCVAHRRRMRARKQWRSAAAAGRRQ